MCQRRRVVAVTVVLALAVVVGVTAAGTRGIEASTAQGDKGAPLPLTKASDGRVHGIGLPVFSKTGGPSASARRPAAENKLVKEPLEGKGAVAPSAAVDGGEDHVIDAAKHVKMDTILGIPGLPQEIHDSWDSARKAVRDNVPVGKTLFDKEDVTARQGKSMAVNRSENSTSFDFYSLSYEELRDVKGGKVPEYTYSDQRATVPRGGRHSTSELKKHLERADPEFVPSSAYTYTDEQVPTVVHTILKVNHIFSVNMKERSYDAVITLKYLWHDPRLAYWPENFSLDGDDFIVLSGNDADFDLDSVMWHPNPYIYNAIKTTRLESLTRVYLNGAVEWVASQRVSLTADYELSMFPFDTQSLPIMVEEYKYPSSQVLYKGEGAMLNPRMKMSAFVVHDLKLTRSETILYDNGLNFSIIDYEVRINRQSAGYFSKTFLPVSLITFAGSISFLIDPKAVPARVSVVCICFLTSLSYYGSTSKEFPKVAQLTILDIYMMVCMAFAFFNALEFAYVHTMGRVENKQGEMVESFWKVGKLADRVCVFLYPGLFIAFSIFLLIVVPEIYNPNGITW